MERRGGILQWPVPPMGAEDRGGSPVGRSRRVRSGYMSERTRKKSSRGTPH